MSCVRIPLVGDSDASWFIDGLPRTLDTVPAINWTILIAHWFLDDTPWTHSGLFP